MKIKQTGKRLCGLLLACAVLLSGVLGAAAPVLRAQALAPDEIDSFLDALSEQVPMMVFLEGNPEGNLTYNCDYANEIVHEALYADFTPRSEVQFVYATQGDESRNSGFSLNNCWLGRYAPMVGLYGDSYSPDLSMTQSTITSWYSFGDVTSFCIPFTQSKLLSYELYVNAPDPSHRRTLPFRGYTLIVAPDANGNARFVKNQSGDILIEVTGVMAEYMDETIVVTIDGLGTITFAGNDFAKLMANNAATEALGAALYAYGAAAKACFRPELNTVDGDMEVPVPTPGGNTP